MSGTSSSSPSIRPASSRLSASGTSFIVTSSTDGRPLRSQIPSTPQGCGIGASRRMCRWTSTETARKRRSSPSRTSKEIGQPGTRFRRSLPDPRNRQAGSKRPRRTCRPPLRRRAASASCRPRPARDRLDPRSRPAGRSRIREHAVSAAVLHRRSRRLATDLLRAPGFVRSSVATETPRPCSRRRQAPAGARVRKVLEPRVHLRLRFGGSCVDGCNTCETNTMESSIYS